MNIAALCDTNISALSDTNIPALSCPHLLSQGVVRKRVLPFLRHCLHPNHSAGQVVFSAVSEDVSEQFQSSAPPLENRMEAEIGTISLPLQIGTGEGSEAELSVGDILSINSTGDICCALVRLEKVLPLIPTAELPVFECRLNAPDGLSVEAHNSSLNSDALPIHSSVTPIRPPFWVDRDPVTQNRIDTHSN